MKQQSTWPNGRALTIILLTTTVILFLAAGAWRQSHLFQSRGIPTGLPEPIPHGGVRAGINVYLNSADPTSLETTLAEIAATGVQWIKQPFYYQEPFDWELAERLVTAAASHNLTLVPLLDGDPAHQFAPPPPAQFAAWAGEFATRFGQTVDYYIIWDEPNLTSHWGWEPVNPAAYAALLTAASQAIRQADGRAVIIHAPLAPTRETGPQNLSETLFLQAVLDAGASSAFDVVAAKPYGFDSGPDDRRVNANLLNFSRVILLRELLAANGEDQKAIWAGNWGWNSLSSDWSGQPSIWGQTDAATQADWTAAALQRAQREWPWMGAMFLENWQPDAAPDDPRWGFAIAGQPARERLAAFADPERAYPGFHLAQPDGAGQTFDGGWRFSPEFGADISQSGDSATFHFWGSEIGLRVRRADYRARLHVTIDGGPANALPGDEVGSALVLTAPDARQDRLETVVVARNLPPGPHTLTLTADRGWDQWALHGFSVGYRPSDSLYRWGTGSLLLLGLLALIVAMRIGWRVDWGPGGRRFAHRVESLSDLQQGALAVIGAALVSLSGWLIWSEQAAGLYRRLGDSGQLALTAAAASIFYVAPSFFIFLPALLLLGLLIYLRPIWGLFLVALTMPFYVPQDILKPIANFRFSPVEVFTLVTAAAVILAKITNHQLPITKNKPRWSFILHRWSPIDWGVLAFVIVATIATALAEWQQVAWREWRVVIIEPALLYLLLRLIRPSSRTLWLLVDGFVLSGLLVAGWGLWQYAFQPEQLITAEGGLLRLRANYGSPNNVALYLGRILPLLAAVVLAGTGRRRLVYGLLAVPVGLALLLTFSKGALFLGVPGAFLVILVFWRWRRGQAVWPVAAAAVIILPLLFLLALQVPPLAARLDPQGITSIFRLQLWQASANMTADHPLFGVGPDNFLYQYRGRYILNAAWQEPDLNHPHNIFLDLSSRLGLLGLVVGSGLIVGMGRQIWRALGQKGSSHWPLALGLAGALTHLLLHGLVDHSLFLVDLAFSFFLLLGLSTRLGE
jgi:O-antigen ligase